jgi:mannose-6-phosphate isomerase-like protein (cupin superfamily)
MAHPLRSARIGLVSTLVVAFAAGSQAQTRSRPAPLTTLNLLVTSRNGSPVASATVGLEGPVSREGTTGADGTVPFASLPAGTYRCHIEADGYTTLEKEIDIKAGTPASAQASLSPALEPTPPPPPAPAPAEAPALTPGSPTVIDITDLAQQVLAEKGGIAQRAIGCSGATSARLYRLNDPLPAQTREGTDVMLYVVAGEATLTIGGQEEQVEPGSFSIVPRGTSYAVARRGRNPVLLLAIASGPPCSQQ